MLVNISLFLLLLFLWTMTAFSESLWTAALTASKTCVPAI